MADYNVAILVGAWNNVLCYGSRHSLKDDNSMHQN